MKTHFYLNRPESDTPTSVYLQIKHAGKRTKFSTGISVHKDKWDKEGERMKVPRSGSAKTEAMNTNTALNEIMGDVSQYELRCTLDEVAISAHGLKEYLNKKYKTPKSSNDRSSEFLTDYMAKYVEGIEKGEIKHFIKNRWKRYADSTLVTKKSVLKILQEYEQTHPRIRFATLDMKVYHRLISWQEQKVNGVNYTGKLIKEIKVVARRSYDEGLHSNTIFQQKEFAKIRESVPAIYLSLEELDALARLNLKGRKAYYRDLFLVGCYTAMRYSDYSRIRPENIKGKEGEKYIQIHTKKTDEEVFVPIAAAIIDILESPDYMSQKPVSAQHFDREVKKICKLAGIDEPIAISRTIGGLTKIITKPKYEMVASHCARRTGATHLHQKGESIKTIMSITGHKDESSLLNYIKTSKKEAAMMAMDNEFYQRRAKTATVRNLK